MHERGCRWIHRSLQKWWNLTSVIWEWNPRHQTHKTKQKTLVNKVFTFFCCHYQWLMAIYSGVFAICEAPPIRLCLSNSPQHKTITYWAYNCHWFTSVEILWKLLNGRITYFVLQRPTLDPRVDDISLHTGWKHKHAICYYNLFLS